MASTGTPADPFEQLERAVTQIGWLSQRQFMQLLTDDRFDLTVPQFHTLLHLSHSKAECKMSDLARATHQSAASLTGVVDRLLDKQLVERIRPDGDRRQVKVILTERGRELLLEIKQAHHAEMRVALSSLSEQETREMLRLLTTILQGMVRLVEERERR